MNEFDELDKLLMAKERVQLEIGWASHRWLMREQNISRAELGRAALSYAIDELSQRYVDCFSSPRSARKNIGDWLRVTEYFTEARVAELPAGFTYHHLRACYIGTRGIPELIEINVKAAVEFAAENKGHWPPVNGTEETVNLVERAKRACQRVVDAGEGSDDFRHFCELIANYQAGEDGNWPDCPLDEQQKQVTFVT